MTTFAIKQVELTAVDTNIETRFLAGLQQQQNVSQESALDFDTDDPDEAGYAEAPTTPVSAEPPAGMYFPVMVFDVDLREYYPRKEGREGTRLVYRNGAARIVKETFAEVKAAFAAAAMEVRESD